MERQYADFQSDWGARHIHLHLLCGLIYDDIPMSTMSCTCTTTMPHPRFQPHSHRPNVSFSPHITWGEDEP